MKTTALLLLGLSLFGTGCSYVTSTVNSEPNVSGELWYVKSSSFMGLTFDSSIWYCGPTTGGAATCIEARIEPNGPSGSTPRKAASDASENPPAQPAREPAAPAEKAEPPKRSVSNSLDTLWDVVTNDVEEGDGCAEVLTLLQSDADCASEQCRPALALATVYGTRCESAPEESRAIVKKLRAKWGKQIDGQPTGCYSMLLRALTSREDASAYGQCLTDRKAGKVEELIISAGTKTKSRR